MAKKKKDVGSAGRFGTRYGRVARKEVAEVEKTSRAKHVCPSCESESVKRVSSGIWQCRKCSHKFAGGAYAPETDAGETAHEALKQAKEEAEDVDVEA